MAEHNSAEGYFALKKQANPDVAVTPNTYVPYYNQKMATNPGFQSDEPIFGNPFKRFQTLQGMREHTGSFSVMAEPNTGALFVDMVATRTSTTGSSPYTHTYQASISTQPNYYTVDISLGSMVVRFWGVQLSKLAFAWDKEKMVFNGDATGLHSFYSRNIASVSGTVGSQTITLATDYDPAPTQGLVVGDLMRAYDVSTQTWINFTVATVPSATAITTTTDVTVLTANDQVTLRAATPSYALLTPFIWPRSQFFFANDATTAFANSATPALQTRLEPGTDVSLSYDFKDDGGSKRSGSYDPASLTRERYDLEFKPKVFLDTPEQFTAWNTLSKRAMVMRCYSGANAELRVTMNDLRALTDETPTEKDNVIYHEVNYSPNYSTPEGQAFDIKIINNIATV